MWYRKHLNCEEIFHQCKSLLRFAVVKITIWSNRTVCQLVNLNIMFFNQTIETEYIHSSLSIIAWINPFCYWFLPFEVFELNFFLWVAWSVINELFIYYSCAGEFNTLQVTFKFLIAIVNINSICFNSDVVTVVFLIQWRIFRDLESL